MSNTKITSHVIEAGAVHTIHIASGAISAAHLTGITTANITENTNLYYTDSRARSSISVTGGNLSYDPSTGVIQLTDGEIRDALSAGTGVTYSSGQFSIGQAVGTSDTVTFGNITTTGYLRGPSNFTIDPAAYGDDTGTLIIAGNLQVDGTTTTINSTTLTVDDLNITLASGAANAAAASGAGLTVDGASATLTYASSDDSWAVNKRFKAQSDIRVGSEGKRLSTDGNGEFGVGYGQTATNNLFTVYDNTSPALRLNSAGDLLVGKTSGPNYNVVGVDLTHLGEIQVTGDNRAVATFNRKTTNGDIAVFRKDGTEVGSIGVDASDNMYFESTASSHTGLTFPDNAIVPRKGGSNSNAGVDLGHSSVLFNDIWMAGILNVRHSSSGELQFIRDDSTVNINNSLGQINFGSTEDSGTTVNYSAGIHAFSSQNHVSGSASGGYLDFKVTPDNSTTMIQKMRLTDDGSLLVGGQTSSNHGGSGRTTLEIAGTSQALIGTTINGTYSTYMFDTGQAGALEINHPNSVYVNADDNFRVLTGTNNEVMRVTNDTQGQVLIGAQSGHANLVVRDISDGTHRGGRIAFGIHEAGALQMYHATNMSRTAGTTVTDSTASGGDNVTLSSGQLYGPYHTLPRGQYRMCVKMKTTDASYTGDAARLTLHVSSGTVVPESRTVRGVDFGADNKWQTFSVPFQVTGAATNAVEFYLFALNSQTISVDYFFIMNDTDSYSTKIFGNQVVDGQVMIGADSPLGALNIEGKTTGGIRLKQDAQIGYTPTSADNFNQGISFVNAGSSHAFGIGYGQGGILKFSYYDNASTYSEILKLESDGDVTSPGAVTANSFRTGGVNDRWKIRNNNGNTELAFEYSTSSALSDANIKVKFVSNGNVLLATNSDKTIPNASLDVAADVGVSLQLSSQYNYGPNRNWAFRTNNYGSSNWGGWSLEQSTSQQGTPNVARIGVHTNGNVGINMGGDASSGLTSINPATALHVGGDITVGCADTVGSSGAAAIRFQNDNERARISSIYASGGGGELSFYTDNTSGSLIKRMHISNNGELRFFGPTNLQTGGISSEGNDSLVISGNGVNSAGIHMHPSQNCVVPAEGSGRAATDTKDLGRASNAWRNIYLQTGIVQPDDTHTLQHSGGTDVGYKFNLGFIRGGSGAYNHIKTSLPSNTNVMVKFEWDGFKYSGTNFHESVTFYTYHAQSTPHNPTYVDYGTGGGLENVYYSSDNYVVIVIQAHPSYTGGFLYAQCGRSHYTSDIQILATGSNSTTSGVF